MLDWWRKNRPLVLGVVLIFAALLWYTAGLRTQDQTNLLERSALLLTGPFHEGMDGAIRGVADVWSHYLFLIDTEQRNEQLHAENRTLRSELVHFEEIALENERLRQLLGFKQDLDAETLPARVIAEDASSWFRTILIDKGTEDGVEPGMPVVAAEGVVGRVVRSTSGQARVLLITDASSAMAALIQHNRARGICRGKGDDLSFDFVLRREDVNVGDRVVTSGMGGVFPKGLVIGHITSFHRQEFSLFQSIEVTPAVDFAHLEEILVLLKEVE